MELTPEQNATYAIALKNLLEVTSHVGLSKEDSLKIGAGKWLVDYIKQLQTVAGIAKTMSLKKSSITNVDSLSDSALPPTLTEPLV